MLKKEEKILQLGVLFLVLILPLIYVKNIIYPYIFPKTVFFYFFVELLFFLWVYISFSKKTYRIRKKEFLYFIPIGLFLVWFILSGFFAINPGLSFWSSVGRGTGILTILHCLLFSFLIVSLIKNNGKTYLDKLFSYALTGGFILGLSLWFGNEGFGLILKNSGGGGLAGNSSLAAAYLLFPIAFGFFLLFSKTFDERKRWWVYTRLSIIIFSPIFINVLGIFNGRGLFGSARAATIGLLLGIPCAIMFCLILSNKRYKKILGFLILFIGILAFYFGWQQLIKSNTFLHNEFSRVATGGSRFVFWDIAQKSIDQHPWFGYGPENFMIAFQKNFNPEILNDNYNHESWNDRAHNLYYDIGVSGGYPAIFFYTIFLIYIFFYLYKIHKNKILNEKQITIFGTLLVVFILQSLFYFDSVLSLVFLFLFFGVIVGLLNKEVRQEEIGFLEHKKIISLLFVLFLISFELLCFFYFVYLPTKKVIYYKNAIILYKNFNIDSSRISSSIGEHWDAGGFADDLYKMYASDPLTIKNDKKISDLAVERINNSLSYFEYISQKNTTDYRLYISIFRLYSTKIYLQNSLYDLGMYNHMLDVLKKAEELSPSNPEVYWGMAQLYAWHGDLKGIVDSYEKAVIINPYVSSSHKLLIQFAKNIGDKKLYETSLDRAKKYIPGFSFK